MKTAVVTSPSGEEPSRSTERNGKNALREVFRVVANRVSVFMGSAYAFASAVLLIVVWLISGPLFQYSDTWQLIINTSTTIITFLMVFLIQNTQNRDTRTLHLKIDELLRSIESARTGLVDLDDLPEEELEKIQEQFRGLAAECKKDEIVDAVQNISEKKRISRSKN
jgi:low affinity Fe/Cu permease